MLVTLRGNHFDDSRKEVSLALQISERQVSRLSRRLDRREILRIQHGLLGRASCRRTEAWIRERIRFLYREKYLNINLTQFHDLLERDEKIEVRRAEGTA